MRARPVCTLVAAMKALMPWHSRTAFWSKWRRNRSRNGSSPSGLRIHGVSVRCITSAHSAASESSRFQVPRNLSNGVRWIGLVNAIAPNSVQNALSSARAPSGPFLAQPCMKMTAFMAPALVPLSASISRRPSSTRASRTPQVKAPCDPPPCKARLILLRSLMSLSSAAGRRYDFVTMARDGSSFSMAEGGSKSPSPDPWRKRPSTILWVLSLGQLITWGLVYYTFPLFVVPMEKELGWSRDQLYGALSAGLLVAGLCSIPVGAWIDRGHAWMLMTGGSVLTAILMFVWSRTDSLAVFYALWIGLGTSQAVTLYEPAFAVITRVYGPRRSEERRVGKECR